MFKTFRHVPAFLVTAIFLPAVAAADPGDLIKATLLCQGESAIPVVFVNPANGGAYAVAVLENELIAMHSVVSASGARYRSNDGPDTWQIWARGDRATVSREYDGQERVRFQDCLLQR